VLIPADIVGSETFEPPRDAEELTQHADIHHVVAVRALGEKILPAPEPGAGCLGKWE
jgi:hypothetical protein